DYQTALQQLMVLFIQLTHAKTNREKSSVFCQLREWISGLPCYIKGLFGELSCES
ncbi:IS4 family transposase, partial [Paenibacillus sp. N3.4]